MIILGSTGSIGVQALQIIKSQNLGSSQNLRVEVLCAGDNIALLNAQIAEFRPKIVVIKDRAKKDLVKGAKVVLCGEKGILEALNIASSDFVLNALVGFSGVRPSLEAIRLNKTLALANKESLVVAGFLIDSADLARIIPVDSEHFALKELLDSALGNSSSGASCGDLADFGHCADSSLALHPKSAKNSTTSTANTRICLDSANQKNSPSLAEVARGWVKTHSLLDSANPQNLIKTPCYSEQSEEFKKNPSLRANPQDLRGNPPIEKVQDLQGRLPRSHSLARNDENLDSSLRKCSAQNDNKIARNAEFSEKIKSKKHIKSFCYFWLLPKVESPLPLNPNLPNNADYAKISGLPRSHSLARNDEILDSSLRLRSAQNDKVGADSAISKSVKKIFITASGGAFRDLPLNQIPRQRAESALKHPNWAMGRKITIDSASMINKVFEILEAKWLFGGRFCDCVNFSQSAESSPNFAESNKIFAESTPNIDAVIERTSTLHAIIQMQNNALLAHFSANDMRLPIASALLGDKAQNLAFVKELDLMDLNVRFEKIDCNRYPLWVLKDEVLKRPKIGAIINAANDILVERFLQNQIYFGDISRGIFAVLDKFGAESMQNIDEILEINAKIKDFLSRFKGFRH